MGIYKIASEKGRVALKNLALLTSGAGLLGATAGNWGALYQGLKQKYDKDELKKAIIVPALGGGLLGAGAIAHGRLNDMPELRGKKGLMVAGLTGLALSGLGATTGLVNYGIGRGIRGLLGGKQEPKEK